MSVRCNSSRRLLVRAVPGVSDGFGGAPGVRRAGAAAPSVSATSSPTARAEAALRYAGVADHRDHLVTALARAGFGTVASAAPFVLVDTSPCGPTSMRSALARALFVKPHLLLLGQSGCVTVNMVLTSDQMSPQIT